MKIDELLKRKMSRREFLGVIGAIMVSFTGLPALIGVLSEKQVDDKNKLPSDGFGSGLYR